MRSAITALLAASAAVIATPALAQDSDIDGWNLNDDGQSCAISKLGEDSRSLTMINNGKPQADGMGFIHLDLNGAIEKGQPVTLGVSINGGEFVDRPATSMVLSGGETGFMLYTVPLSTFVGNPKGTMRFRWNGKIIHSFSMDGMSRASAALMECGKKY
ncbi:hypothetical protein [Sphingomonas sp. G-3-2-10]|uniref:hypothetical protein n=1 Tax=Sphingomonas sp. G-3-2-10 TaxID=2728838 RepID=UPI00146B10B1|nr:hypothetical protein [Sphingomonas sp. G-3-2-10]NML06536.1 hypothetical protein [Sphingomonas sp. G-3-2-10]